MFLNMNAQENRTSKIFIYRPNNLQSSTISYKVVVNDTLTIKIRNNSYYEFNCNHGEYDFTFVGYKNSKLHLTVDKNKTYYLCIGFIIGFWSGSPELLLVDSLSAYPAINNVKMQKLKSKNEILIRPKNRIGANIITGNGRDGYTAFTNSNGGEAKISFGSGFGYKFLLGREINKWFDITSIFKYQKSTLVPKVENAEISFERYSISITPSGIIPIQDGDFMRLKIGIGVDYVMPSVLYIYTVKYPNGIADNWNYKKTNGMHIRLVYEVNFSKYFSLQYGFTWNTVTYQFIKGNYYYPIIDKLNRPDGSGLDLFFGLNIHF
ncbi:MAG: hypothetical protein A3H98_01960 [Bacteroidetes bacterium RIFCSPLOWO2_02_FULL_36_8]|nr:MAG: hypothetical protein A3H98_01960 [Bacteroidetes bacterium RIFCSPLOWO2_02_FULL_36_8]OFY70717.1 MAG: hypothetical protein A3G23_08365 [Bacteroidetes bacterium RIFCSPLOWO2_12_FULL_37_12]